jgi:hypothetical protein
VLHHVRRRGRRFAALVAAGALLGSLLTAVSTVSPIAPSAEAAPPASAFDPGFIISDAVMFDGGAMSVDAIQSFLNSKVASCSASASQPCLKDYRTDTHDIAAVANRCTGNIRGASNQSAAQVIFAVAQACQINPRVLLVTLQKEQGLVTSTSPTATKYKIAMGYGCPDTAPCDSEYFGFFNQVYQAAYAYNKYTKSPSSYPRFQPGTRKIDYNPKTTCGSKTVTILNKATTALYTYTPYVPNAAALANPYGVGDSCSAYGNRNFWLYFNDWFGSSVAGSFVVDTPGGSTFVLTDGTKWEIPANRTGILASIAPLGATARVSDAYAAGFPTAGTFGNLVKDAGGHLFLLDNGRRLSVPDCGQAADLGFPCGSVPTLTAAMLALFPDAGAMSNTVTTGGETFVLRGGARSELLDAASAQAAGVSIQRSVALLDDTLSTVPVGAPIARAGALASVRGTDTLVYLASGSTYEMSSTFVEQAAVATRLGGVAGSLSPQSVALLPQRSTFAGLYSANGGSFVLTAKGAYAVTNPSGWGGTFVPMDAAAASGFATVGTVTAPVFVTDQSSKTTYLLTGGRSRPAATNSAVRALAKKFHTSTKRIAIAGPTFAASGRPLLAPASLVKSSKKSTKLWLLDGTAKKRAISAAQAKEIRGSAKARVVGSTTINGYRTVSGSAKLGLKAAGAQYIADGGVLRRVSAADAKRYGKRFGFGAYDASTIAHLKVGTDIGRVIKVGSKYYEVKNAKKVRITSAAAKKLSRSTGRAIQPVHAYVGRLLPTK